MSLGAFNKSRVAILLALAAAIYQAVPGKAGPTAGAPVTIERITDLEGDKSKLDAFVERAEGISYDARGDLVIEPGFHFVYGGDGGDRGPFGREIYRLLARAKKKYPDRVTLIAGNRDINKMRLYSELMHPERWKERLELQKAQGRPPYSAQPDTPANRLKWLLEATLGAPKAFAFRQEELTRNGGKPASDEEVLRSFLEDLGEGGSLREYLKGAELLGIVDDTLIPHGVINEQTLGRIPGSDEVISDIREWAERLNQWYRNEVADWERTDGLSGAEELMKYQAPDPKTPGENQASIVYGRFMDLQGNLIVPSDGFFRVLMDQGFRRILAGHKPQGQIPTIMKVAGFEIILDDNSYDSPHANYVRIRGDETLAEGIQEGIGIVTYRSGPGVADSLGTFTHDGLIVVGRDVHGNLIGKHFLPPFTVEVTIVDPSWITRFHFSDCGKLFSLP